MRICVALVVLGCAPPAHANDIQRNVLDASINLGWVTETLAREGGTPENHADLARGMAFAEVGFYFGRAHIAALHGDLLGRGHLLWVLRSAIRAGLRQDAERGYGFGAQADWDRLPVPSGDTSLPARPRGGRLDRRRRVLARSGGRRPVPRVLRHDPRRRGLDALRARRRLLRSHGGAQLLHPGRRTAVRVGPDRRVRTWARVGSARTPVAPSTAGSSSIAAAPTTTTASTRAASVMGSRWGWWCAGYIDPHPDGVGSVFVFEKSD